MSNVFKAEFKITTQSILGKADIKRLRSQLMEEFPLLTKKMLDKVLRVKEETDVHLLKCSNGTHLYVPGDGPAAFFDDGFGAVFPTLFTLWMLPSIIPELVTHGPVSKFLLPKERGAGADMMLPGVIVPEGGLGKFAAGQKRCIRVEGNDAPFAVGKMLVSSDDVAKTGMKGKGMAVLHVYRDSLWSYGGRKVPNDGFLADEIAASSGTGAAAGEDEDEDEDDEEDDEPRKGERRSGERRSGEARASGPVEAVGEMDPDALMEYCFWAAFKTTCTDSELPLTADKFYLNHMQPARPAGQPTLDAKKTSYKQVGKFIKHMHKQKWCNVRDVKNIITILSVDRASAAYEAFELLGTSAAKAKEEVSAAGAAGGAREEAKDEPLRTKPPVVTDLWQPNSYTKPLFEAVGKKDKSATYTLGEAHAALEQYIRTKLVLGGAHSDDADGGAGGEGGPVASATGGDVASASAEGPPEVCGFLRYAAGMPSAEATAAADALATEGFDSVAALQAGGLDAAELSKLGVPEAYAAPLANVLSGNAPDIVRAWLVSSGGVADDATAVQIAAALAADGFDSLGALAVGALTVEELQSYGAGATTASAIVDAIAKLKLIDGTPTPPPPPTAGGSVGTGLPDFDPAAVPLDELLLNALVKLAGGAKKGTTFATHMSLAELKASLKERMTAFHRVEVQGEAPSIRKGALKPISIEMKRAAGHNKTHVSGLESFCISPQAVSDALKVKLGCTTAVLKLPGNNTKDVEVLLQGHCVNEVCDYLRDVYCIDKQWIELKLKESKRSNT